MEAENIDFDEGTEQQVEDTQPETVDEVEESDEGQEHSEETPEQPEEPHVTFTEEQQKFINEKIVGRKVAQMREAERRAEELQQRLEEMQSQIPQQPSGAPEIPPMPDVWDSDYERKVEERDQAILAKAQWERDQEYSQYQQQMEQQRAAQEFQQKLTSKVMSYTEKAKSFGISEKDLQVAGNAVAQFDIPNELTDYILEHEQGPAVTMYLAKNLHEISNLQNLNPVRAAVYIEKNIAPKVSRSVRRNSPPDPTESPRGSGMPEKRRGPKGATFE